MEIFDEFIIIGEKAIGKFAITGKSSHWEMIGFVELEFTSVTTDFSQALKIADIGNASSNPSNEEPLAQIICWNWDQNGAQQISETKTLNKGSAVNFASFDDTSSFVIRILKKREKKSEEKRAFPAPSDSSPDDDLTVKIGEKQVAVSAHWLMTVSPVIIRMMKEKQQRMITLDELGVGMDQFIAFLESIFYMTKIGPFLPNPTNVLALLKLADYFQVAVLKSRCELHLINCVEIPLIDRFLLIERFGLDNLKNYFLHLNIDNFRAFFNANHEQFLPIISKEFLCALSV